MPRRGPSTPCMRSIDSASIDSLGYDEDTNALYVRFRDSGDTYAYYMVPRRVYEELSITSSPGRYLNTNVKSKYPFAKVASAA